jgi:hypothetical protein
MAKLIYGRRMYEAMVAWETAHTFADQRPVPGLVMGYGRLPLPSVPGVVGALARASQST